MRHTAIIAATLAALLALAAPAQAGMVEDCNQASDLDLGIGGCTAVIRSGQHSGRNLAMAYYNRGIAYHNLGEYAQAIEDYDQALRIDPGYAGAYTNRGGAYIKLRKYRRAIENFDQALRLDPGDDNAYNNRGFSYKYLGDYERAVSDWEQAIRIAGAPQVKWYQKYLKGRGAYSGEIDGIYGPGTRSGLVACARDPFC